MQKMQHELFYNLPYAHLLGWEILKLTIQGDIIRLKYWRAITSEYFPFPVTREIIIHI